MSYAGTIFREEDAYNSGTDSLEGETYVSGQCQISSRECFQAIGAYKLNKGGDIDWMAVTAARMMGWKTRPFREKCFFLHRKLASAERGRFSSTFPCGEKDYCLGCDPMWEVFRMCWRMTRRPYLLDGAALRSGDLWALI
jgi:biofilm PGA synthesis N-glycosyltransferase PgaC